MLIRVNNSKMINVVETFLTVKNGRLYNLNSKCNEGVDGDRVTFSFITENGGKCWVSGTVDGYTCNRRVKLKGNNTVYLVAEDCSKMLDCTHIVSNQGENYILETDWELVLKG